METRKLSVREKIGYGMGDAGCNIIFGAIMLFVNYFYTDIFGLAPALVGVLLLSVRVIDAVTGPIMGALADRTRSKYGRFRPWLLWIAADADPLNPENWQKSPHPVFTTSNENRQYGPGHNSFTKTPDGEDVLIYHARNYTEIEGDPLFDPNRHTRLKLVHWKENGMPDFGIPPADTI